MSVDFFARIIGMAVFTIAGLYFGDYLQSIQLGPPYLTTIVMGLVGALVGLILTPFFSTRPMRNLEDQISQTPSRSLFAGLGGLIVGLVIAALLSYPVSLMPPPLGKYLPVFVAVLFGYLGFIVFTSRQNDIFNVLRPNETSEKTLSSGVKEKPMEEKDIIVLDTSVIIDGRIEDIAKTGFLPGTLMIPHFVLLELQYIADSSDALRRQRGRRGMEVLANLQKEPMVDLEIVDLDFEDVSTVDDKLVMLAKKTGGSILTNDYNLNRIAELQGVTILNINELANAVKAVYLPGEALMVEIIQEGKEYNQGVGYLDDGTMIVVENGSMYLGKQIPTTVTKVLQTAAGRMIFSRPTSEED